MGRKSDNLAARQQTILQLLQAQQTVSIPELCSLLGASLATVRRDLEELEGRSLLKRTRGGAVPIGPLFYEPFRNDQSFQIKVGSFADEKRRIAQAAAQLVSKGQTVALSGGTTATEVVRALKVLSDITIVTNSVNAAMELSNRKDIDVILTGGSLRGNWFTLVGPIANQASELIFSDIMILGVDGIDAQHGLTCTNASEAEVLRRLAAHAKHKVVVCDRSKLGNVSQWALCAAKDVQHIITDTGATDEMLEPFASLGIQVTRA